MIAGRNCRRETHTRE